MFRYDLSQKRISSVLSFFKLDLKLRKKLTVALTKLLVTSSIGILEDNGWWYNLSHFCKKKIGAFQKRRGISIIIYLPMTFPQSFPNSCSLPKGTWHFQKKATSKNIKWIHISHKISPSVAKKGNSAIFEIQNARKPLIFNSSNDIYQGAQTELIVSTKGEGGVWGLGVGGFK